MSKADDDDVVLDVRDLTVAFGEAGTRAGAGASTGKTAVDAVSFAARRGEIVGLVGESGSGKTVSCLAIMGLLPKRGEVVAGSVRLEGRELVGLDQREASRLRGRDMAMVFQDPLGALNPVHRIGRQIAEALFLHRGLRGREAAGEVQALLRAVGMPDPAHRAREYPHQLSGGMNQRAMIAMAIACRPKLLIADEPTTALDVTIQAQILELLRAMRDKLRLTVLLVTHDLGVVAELADRVVVMRHGRVVERGPVDHIFHAPQHAYTQGLLDALPRLDRPVGRLVPVADEAA